MLSLLFHIQILQQERRLDNIHYIIRYKLIEIVTKQSTLLITSFNDSFQTRLIRKTKLNITEDLMAISSPETIDLISIFIIQRQNKITMSSYHQIGNQQKLYSSGERICFSYLCLVAVGLFCQFPLLVATPQCLMNHERECALLTSSFPFVTYFFYQKTNI